MIILGTGFEIAEPPIAQRIYNRHGQNMADVWQGSPQGYMGTMVADCPNGFLMMDAIRQARQHDIRSIEPDPERIAAFNSQVQDALKNTVWNSGGCSSYFIDRNGRNSTVWPWTTFKMRQQLSHFNLNEYLLDQHAGEVAQS